MLFAKLFKTQMIGCESVKILHKNIITNNSTYRKIIILEELSKSKNGVTCQDLSISLDISKKTVSQDINALITQSDTKFLEFENGVYSLICDSDSVILEIEQKMLLQEPLYKILIAYQKGNIKTLSEWAHTFFISDSTLIRYLKKLNLVLQEYSLTIKYNPVSIIGLEVNIRIFLYHFLIDAITFDYNYDPTIIKLYSSMINHIQNETPLHPTVNSNMMIYWILVTKSRIENGNYIFLSKNVIESKIFGKSSRYFLEIWNLFDLQCPPEYQDSELTFMMLIHTDANYYAKDIPFDFINEKFQSVEQFFSEMILLFPMKSKFRKQLYRDYKAYFFNVSQLTLLSPQFQKNVPELNEYVEIEFSDIYLKVNKLVNSYEATLNNSNLTHLTDIAVNLTLIISAYSNYLESNYKKVGVYINGNMNFVLLMQKRFSVLENNNVTLYFFSYEELTIKNIALLGISSFITNDAKVFQSLTQNKKLKILKISEYPTNFDWIKLSKFILE